MEIGQVVVLKGDTEDGWWVGEIKQLLESAWDYSLADDHPNQPTNDMVVLEYKGAGANSNFKKLTPTALGMQRVIAKRRSVGASDVNSDADRPGNSESQ